MTTTGPPGVKISRPSMTTTATTTTHKLDQPHFHVLRNTETDNIPKVATVPSTANKDAKQLAQVTEVSQPESTAITGETVSGFNVLSSSHTTSKTPTIPSTNPFESVNIQISDSMQAQLSLPKPLPPKRGDSNSIPLRTVLYSFVGTRNGELSVNAGELVTFDGSTPDGQWTYCIKSGVKAERGIVPTSYLENPNIRHVIKDERAKIPLGFDYGKEDGYARDIIAVRSFDGTFAPCTLPVARFTGASASKEGERVQVYVDGRASFEMRIGPGGSVIGIDGVQADLSILAPFVLTQKERSAFRLRFEHSLDNLDSRNMRYCESTLWVWRANDVVVVSDVDGTVTKSDVKGHWNTTLRQKVGLMHRGYAHDGICVLFDHLVGTHACRLVYLTARPLDLSNETRGYLETLGQGDFILPSGPVITDSTTYYGSLKREVVEHTSHIFKTEYLLDLKRMFQKVGRDVDKHPVFMCGFGNKDTDAIAYAAVGIPHVLTFLIDQNSVVKCLAGFADAIESYADVKMMAWIDEMCIAFLHGKLVLSSVVAVTGAS